MSSNKCFFLIVATTLSLSLLINVCSGKISQGLMRKIFDCSPCTNQCPELSYIIGCEPVLESGVCACCYQCARQMGERCGLTIGRCSKDLACLPLPGASDPFRALLEGSAVCTPLDVVL